MNKTNAKRVQRLAEHIDTLPLAPAVVQTAFEHFCGTAELPESQRLAEAVVDRVLHGKPEEDAVALAEIVRVMARLCREGQLTLPPGPPPPSREKLFREVLSEEATVRSAARLALRMLLWAGRNLVAPKLLDESEIPEGDVVGPHVIATWLRGSDDGPGDTSYAEALQQRVREGDPKLAAAFDRAAKATTGRRARALTSLRRALCATMRGGGGQGSGGARLTSTLKSHRSARRGVAMPATACSPDSTDDHQRRMPTIASPWR